MESVISGSGIRRYDEDEEKETDNQGHVNYHTVDYSGGGGGTLRPPEPISLFDAAKQVQQNSASSGSRGGGAR